uniref:Uncharacterized protein n=1 Tax=Candidatus Methanogaster sp. ANME-2c ERB4 TaxID=2759911 RepID=A0A7G9Y1Y4_9EURY|nr:hypothetical protein JAMFHPCN_00001 [Methanosarcinales archaeon ANME-2c ERB4]QNO42525.1 hypothetical protein KMCHGNIM_00015 [Methanosarcinales archaeon ANME-2c ERB4]QNO48721.1 hypothetical protein IBEPLGGF_00001 [Methanosarcinales archaeon ANME-2c ERB4]
MHNDYVVLACEIDHLLKKREISDCRSRVVRIIEKDQFGFICDVRRYCVQIGQETGFCEKRHSVGHAACKERPDFVDRVCRIRHKHDVARVYERKRDVRNPFFRSDECEYLPHRVKRDIKRLFVPFGCRLPKGQHSCVRGVLVPLRVVRGRTQRIDDVGWRWQVRIADAEIDDIDPLLSRIFFCFIDRREKIGRKRCESLCVHTRIEVADALISLRFRV